MAGDVAGAPEDALEGLELYLRRLWVDAFCAALLRSRQPDRVVLRRPLAVEVAADAAAGAVVLERAVDGRKSRLGLDGETLFGTHFYIFTH